MVLYDFYCMGRIKVNTWFKVNSSLVKDESNQILLLHPLQARDEVITVLKAEKLDLALLEAKYGFVTPEKVLQALQRDAIQGKAEGLQEDIYEKPMEEVTAPFNHN